MLTATPRCPLALLAALSFAACSSSPTTPSRSAVVELNAREYVATRIHPESTFPQYQVTVVSRIRNTGSGPLYLERCGASSSPVYGIELVRPTVADGSAYNPAWACPASPPLDLAPGRVRTDTLRLLAPSGVKDGRVLGALSGTMRIVFATNAEIRSEEFTIRLP